MDKPAVVGGLVGLCSGVFFAGVAALLCWIFRWDIRIVPVVFILTGGVAYWAITFVQGATICNSHKP